MKRTLHLILLCGCVFLIISCGKKRDARAELKLKRASGLPEMQFAPGSAGYSNWCFTWTKEIYVGGYQQAGRRNPRWDEAATNALDEYAYLRLTGKASDSSAPEYLDAQLKKAVNAGCDDPFIRYLYLRRITHPFTKATPPVATDYANLAKQMDASGYANILKFYVNLRAAQAWRAASAKQAPEVNQLRRVAMGQLQTILTSEEIPARLAYEACRDLYDAIDQNKKQRTDFYTNAQPIIAARWPDEGFPYLIKATFYLDFAWEARGAGWAKDVSEADRKLFLDRLDLVEESLDKAWKIDPSLKEAPLLGLRLELGQGKGRERMEMWYKRAKAFPEIESQAIRQKLLYLDPRWYGSEADCLAFAREVMKSDSYYGQELLQPYFVHEKFAQYFRASRPDYWLEPQVWPDIEAAFERFFERNGDDNDWRHRYALCAFRCEQWQALDDQLSKLKEVNYDYFGGKDAYERIKRVARERAKSGG